MWGDLDVDDFGEASKKVHIGDKIRQIWKENRMENILDIDYLTGRIRRHGLTYGGSKGVKP